MQKKAQERLLKVFVELYNRSQQPILTSDLFKNVFKLEGEKKGSGKDYPQSTFYDTGILRIHKEWSKGKKEVVWNTRYPDLDMVENLWSYRKNEYASGRPPKVVESTKTIVEVELEPTPIKSTEFLSYEELAEKYDVEYKNFAPNKGTVPGVRKMLRVMEHNASGKYCHKDKLCLFPQEDEDGKIIDVDYGLGRQFSNKRLVELGVLKKNPENKSEFMFVAQYDDIDDLARKVAFSINHLMCPSHYEGLREERLAKEEKFVEEIQEEIVVELQEEQLQGEFQNTDGLQQEVKELRAELREARDENRKIKVANEEILATQEELAIELRRITEINNGVSTDLSQKLVFLHDVTVIVADVLKTIKTNNIIEKQG